MNLVKNKADYTPIGRNGKNNPTKQGIYNVLRNNEYEDNAVFYPPNAGGRYETNGTWYGQVTHWKKDEQ